MAVVVEQVEPSQRDAIVGVLGDAFAEHPFVPKRGGDARAKLMVRAMLDAFARADDYRVFGIRHGGQWACMAFVFAYGYEPRGLTMATMLWRMVRIVGPRKMMRYGRVMSIKHDVDGRALQLMILGTPGRYQRRGLGRAMMRHVCKYADERGYSAVTLEVAKHTPAFGFYDSEGFEVEQEVELPEMPLCFMRKRLVSDRERVSSPAA